MRVGIQTLPLFAFITIERRRAAFFHLFTFCTRGYDIKEIVNGKRAAD